MRFPLAASKARDHLKHAAAGAGAQIDGKAFRAVEQFERRHVAGSQIHHVNIIPDAGPIGRVIIAAPDVQPVAPPDRDLGNKGDEIIGDAFRILADQAALMGADGIEIAQDRDPPGRVARI